MTGWLRAASVKLYGEPPSKEAPRSSRLAWIRRMHLRMMLFALPAYVCILLIGQTWILVAGAVSALIWLEAVVSVSIRIRRARRREEAL